MGLQHPLDLSTKGQVGEGHDAGGHIGAAVSAAGALGRDPLHELNLAQRFHILRTVFAVHGAAFDEDGPDDVVASAQIAQQVIQEIAVVGPVPKMVVGVTDGQSRLQGLFNGQVQPLLMFGGHACS